MGANLLLKCACKALCPPCCLCRWQVSLMVGCARSMYMSPRCVLRCFFVGSSRSGYTRARWLTSLTRTLVVRQLQWRQIVVSVAFTDSSRLKLRRHCRTPSGTVVYTLSGLDSWLSQRFSSCLFGGRESNGENVRSRGRICDKRRLLALRARWSERRMRQ